MALGVYLLVATIAVALAIVQWHWNQGNLLDRIIAACIPLASCAALMCLWLVVVQGSQLDWNEAKLAPVVGMVRGYRLYQGEGGVLTGWIYGPVGAIALIPVALAPDPTTAVFAGIIISILAYFIPAWAFFWTASRGRIAAPALVAMLLLIFQSNNVEDLYRCIAVASPDAVAVGLATCACLAIYRRRDARHLALSSILVVLCIWTKQNFLPLALGLLLWIALAEGRKSAGIFAAMFIGAGIVITAIFIPLFGASEMFFNMVTLPTNHPWRDHGYGKWMDLLIGLRDLAYCSVASCGLLGGALLLDSSVMPASKGIAAWLRDRPWSLLAFAGISMIPGVLPPYLKVGGYDNSLAPVDFLLALSALTAVVEICAAPRQLQARMCRIASAAMMLCVMVIGSRSLISHGANATVQSGPLLLHPYRNTQQALFEYTKRHPGEIYCPWNPLTTLLADKKLYHFEWGIFDRAYSKLPIDPDQFRSHLPERMTKIVYCGTPQSTAAFDVLVDFRAQTQAVELPGCIVYSRGP